MKPASLVTIILRLVAIALTLLFAAKVVIGVGQWISDLSEPVNWNIAGQFWFRVGFIHVAGLLSSIGLYVASRALGKGIAKGLG